MGFPVEGTKSRCNLHYGDWTTIGWQHRLATTMTMVRRPGYEDVVATPWGTAEASDTVFDRSCELNVRIVSNGSTLYQKWPRALDAEGTHEAMRSPALLDLSLSLSLSLSLPSLPPSFCDVSTTNEFLVRVPTGTWRSIVFAVRQILDFDITGLIDEYDTNQPSRIGYFVWLPLPVHILSDTRQYPPLSHMCSPHQTSSR